MRLLSLQITPGNVQSLSRELNSNACSNAIDEAGHSFKHVKVPFTVSVFLKGQISPRMRRCNTYFKRRKINRGKRVMASLHQDWEISSSELFLFHLHTSN